MHICFHIIRKAIAHHSWPGTTVGEIMSISKYSKLSFDDPRLLPTYICCVYFMLNVAQEKYKCSRINRTINTDIWELESSKCICYIQILNVQANISEESHYFAHAPISNYFPLWLDTLDGISFDLFTLVNMMYRDFMSRILFVILTWK